MTNATSNQNQKLDYTGIQLMTEGTSANPDGLPAKLAGDPTVEVLDGDATAEVTNVDQNAGTFDLGLRPGAADTVSRIKLSVPRDLDGSGDAPIEEEIVYTVTAAEGGALRLPTPVVSQL